jgi:hypothetical protein
MGDAKIDIAITPIRGINGGPDEVALVRHQGHDPHVEQVGPLASYSHWSGIKAAASQSQAAFDLAATAAFGAAYSGLSAAEHRAALEEVLLT